jgi:hypothetical protein
MGSESGCYQDNAFACTPLLPTPSKNLHGRSPEGEILLTTKCSVQTTDDHPLRATFGLHLRTTVFQSKFRTLPKLPCHVAALFSVLNFL